MEEEKSVLNLALEKMGRKACLEQGLTKCCPHCGRMHEDAATFCDYCYIYFDDLRDDETRAKAYKMDSAVFDKLVTKEHLDNWDNDKYEHGLNEEEYYIALYIGEGGPVDMETVCKKHVEQCEKNLNSAYKQLNIYKKIKREVEDEQIIELTEEIR